MKKDRFSGVGHWWWKLLCVLLLFYTFVYGFLIAIPELPILEQSIRNLFFHVPMWFTMIALMLSSTIFGIYYLVKEDIVYDVKSYNIAVVGFVFGLMGLATGMVWAKVTWGAWWVFQEVKLNAAGAGVLIYAAYFILRGSLEEEEKRARFSAVYNVFAFVLFYVFIMVIPRLDVNSLHPGNGGNPGFNSYDLDNNLRKLFYPAVIGFILLGGWISQLFIRIELIKRKKIGLDD
ncbi:MAG: cytochrome c biogenesis protein CcsA [Bacteroidetes bacterium]|nr:cytochrome c biogenesis protein CcsA [Bacteroidota bacterium]MBK9633128.1 cytochrome c biogenesis protein CcsA [Bacteroidota bacterium]